jgi:hypothetical protein
MTPAEMARRRWKGVPRAERRKIMAAAGKLGGRPKRLVACPRGCGHIDGVAAMRAHTCP